MSREVLLPGSLAELWEAQERRPEALAFAGGTDALVQIRAGLIDPPALICLERIEELKRLEDEGETIFIGAGTTHAELLENPLIRARLPIIVEALKTLGSPPIRRMGTLGGNIVTASPAGDSLPPLYVLDAEVELVSRNSVRRLKLAEFITGPGRTRLERGEILAGVRVKKPTGFNVHHFEKVGRRQALAIAVVSLAALMKVSDSGRIEAARLAWGSVGPTVVASPEVEAALIGRPLELESLQRAAALAKAAVSPIDDIRAGADYRRQAAGNLILRLVEYADGRKE